MSENAAAEVSIVFNIGDNTVLAQNLVDFRNTLIEGGFDHDDATRFTAHLLEKATLAATSTAVIGSIQDRPGIIAEIRTQAVGEIKVELDQWMRTMR